MSEFSVQQRQYEGVVAICTRGAVLTEVLDGVLENIMPKIYNGRLWTVRTTKDLGIPDAQNDVTERALVFKPKYIWYVEEDTVPPFGILTKMIQRDADVVVTDYRLEGQNSIHWRNGKILYTGMGCMLVNRTVFSKIKRPFFENMTVTATDDGFAKHSFELPGKQDVGFSVKLYEGGIQIAHVDGMCKHLRFNQLGKRGVNCGLHEIAEIV